MLFSRVCKSPDEMRCNLTLAGTACRRLLRDQMPLFIRAPPLVGLHYRKPVSGRPKSGCRRGGECRRRDDTRAWRAMSGRATASDETRRRRSRTATRRDGQRFARRVHACMSWYTMIYDNIGPTPGPGLIEAKVQRARTLPSSVALLKDDLCWPTTHVFCQRVHSKCW